MINISIDKPAIPEDADFKHKSTSWQIALSRDFENDILAESLEDEENLLEYHLINRLEDNQVVYARVKIYFDNDTESEWSRPITLSERQRGFKLSNTIVVPPTLSVEHSTLNVDNDQLTVYTNDFAIYAGVGKHKSTSWYVELTTGVKVWERLEDEDNLTSIIIPEDVLEKDRFYVLKARHMSDTNALSDPGVLTIATGLADLSDLR